MSPAAKADRVKTFNYHMCKIFEDKPIHTNLCTYRNLKWMRCDFNTKIKCDYIRNNVFECSNRQIKGTKIKCDYIPNNIFECYNNVFESIREKVVILIDKRRIVEMLWKETLPAIIQKINNMTRRLDHLAVGRSTGEYCEFKDTNKRI